MRSRMAVRNQTPEKQFRWLVLVGGEVTVADGSTLGGPREAIGVTKTRRVDVKLLSRLAKAAHLEINAAKSATNKIVST